MSQAEKLNTHVTSEQKPGLLTSKWIAICQG
jgi:hypothetical protein